MADKHDFASTGSIFWKSSILILTVIINLTLVFRLLWGEQSVSAWNDLKARQSMLVGQLDNLDARKVDLSREILLLQTDASYVEKVIRQRLNYVRPNEILYLFDEPQPQNQHWTGADDDD